MNETFFRSRGLHQRPGNPGVTANASGQKAIAMTQKKDLRILSICDDDGIRFSRDLVLARAGYGNVEWFSSNATINASQIRSSDVAILCQSVEWKRAAPLALAFRRLNPEIRILRVNSLRSAMDSRFQLDCEVVTGPGMLIEVLDSLFAGVESSFARSH